MSPGKKHTPLVSVVLSFRNEEPVIPELLDRLQRVLRSLPIRYELIFVNDASTDGSLSLLAAKAKEDSGIKVLTMSRRFGVYECMFAGFEYASGDAVIYMDADLQDPPEVIPKLIENWFRGADVVYTVRTSRAGEPPLKMFLTKIAYRVLRSASDVNLPVDAGDFRLMSRRVVKELLKSNEKDPYFRGLVSWVGFKQVAVPYDREARFAGRSQRSLLTKGPINVFLSGLTSFSLWPLHLCLLAGLIMCLVGLVSIGVMIVQTCLDASCPDWWRMVVAMCFFTGIQMVGIGILGLYLGRVYNQVRSRPDYIVESTVGFDKGASN